MIELDWRAIAMALMDRCAWWEEEAHRLAELHGQRWPHSYVAAQLEQRRSGDD